MPHRRDVLAALGAGTLLAAGVASGQDGGEDGTNGAPTGQWLAVLSGGQEVPPVETDATGTASVVVDQRGNAHYSLVVAGIEDVTMAHIHQGATGENGPVAQWLHPGSEPDQEPQRLVGRFDGVLQEGTFSANDFVGPLSGEDIATLVEWGDQGEAYVNVHTESNPDGEIRGQLRPVAEYVTAVTQTDGQAATTETEATPTETPTETPPNETGTPSNQTEIPSNQTETAVETY